MVIANEAEKAAQALVDAIKIAANRAVEQAQKTKYDNTMNLDFISEGIDDKDLPWWIK